MEKDAKITNIKTSPIAPTREEAEDAVRTILS